MRRALPILALASLAHAQSLVEPRVISITLRVCSPFRETQECYDRIRDWNRAKDISELMPLLTQDFKNLGGATVDARLRAHIAVILRRLEKDDQ